MFRELTNQPRPYQWGDSHSIASWQGRDSAGGPEAELWFGTHPGSEAFVHPNSGGVDVTPLSRWLSGLGLNSTLPFLVKVLAAETPLSIQVHPTEAQARVGFATENTKGIPLDDPRRNYRDESDKPEVLIAWSDQFLALAGIQTPQAAVLALEQISSVVVKDSLIAPVRTALADGPESFGQWLFSREPSVEVLASALTEAWETGTVGTVLAEESDLYRVWERVITHYPKDPGIVAASFLNLVSLSRGEAIFLPAGIPHAYLHGFGLEVMAPSDNVVRGGLTSKHSDREELTKILDPRPLTAPVLEPMGMATGARLFAPGGAPFRILHAEGSELTLPVPAGGAVIVVVESGGFVALADPPKNPEKQELHAGKAYVALLSEPGAVLEGSGSVFVVSV